MTAWDVLKSLLLHLLSSPLEPPSVSLLTHPHVSHCTSYLQQLFFFLNYAFRKGSMVLLIGSSFGVGWVGVVHASWNWL